MGTGLILIDIQQDYFPGGRMELTGSIEAGRKAQQALAFAREHAVPVIHIQHISNRPGASFFLAGTEGAEISPFVQPQGSEAVFIKHYPSSFRDTGLFDFLRQQQLDKLVIAGMMTHMCVEATTRAAVDLGFACTVLHDACATRDLQFNGTSVPAALVQAAFLAGLSGTYANLASVDEWMKSVF